MNLQSQDNAAALPVASAALSLGSRRRRSSSGVGRFPVIRQSPLQIVPIPVDIAPGTTGSLYRPIIDEIEFQLTQPSSELESAVLKILGDVVGNDTTTVSQAVQTIRKELDTRIISIAKQ